VASLRDSSPSQREPGTDVPGYRDGAGSRLASTGSIRIFAADAGIRVRSVARYFA